MIEGELSEFKKYAERMDMKETLDVVGSDKYKKMKENKMNISDKLEYKLPMFFRDLFDVIELWKKVGHVMFPHLFVGYLVRRVGLVAHSFCYGQFGDGHHGHQEQHGCHRRGLWFGRRFGGMDLCVDLVHDGSVYADPHL